jgi:hypothetical protein
MTAQITETAQMILDHIGTMDQASLRAAMEDGELLGRLMTELDLTDAEMQAAAEEIHAFTRPQTRSRDMTTPYRYAVTGDFSRLVYSRHRTRAAADRACRALAARWGWSHPGSEPRVVEL